jgi:hypothetical protein
VHFVELSLLCFSRVTISDHVAMSAFLQSHRECNPAQQPRGLARDRVVSLQSELKRCITRGTVHADHDQLVAEFKIIQLCMPAIALRAEFFRHDSCRQVRQRSFGRPFRFSTTIFVAVIKCPLGQTLDERGFGDFMPAPTIVVFSSKTGAAM